MNTQKLQTLDRRELFFGFVSPIGVDRDLIEDCLRTALCAADYQLDKVHVSDRLESFGVGEKPAGFLERKEWLMDAGDRLRQIWSVFAYPDDKRRGDAVVLASIAEIRQRRESANRQRQPVLPEDPQEQKTLLNNPLQNVASLLDSLKHPDELQTLRRFYGPAFVSIGIYAPPDTRCAFLLKNQHAEASDHTALELAENLIHRDETGENKEGKIVPLGQKVADAFYICDFIVDATKPKPEIVGELTRLVELLFGDLYKTPSLEEVGMFQARGIQVRSGSLAHQIGASILRSDGSVVALGTNEVPRPITGAQYWFKDDFTYRGRDMVYRDLDTSDEFRLEMVEDLLARLDKAGALSSEISTQGMDSNSAEAKKRRSERLGTLYFDKDGPLRRAKLRNTIDYIRTVHAEGAALIDAARHGTATLGCIMFTTTFPCHECARHIVAAGIREVVYLEPYPKSAVRRLYEDSIEVDPEHRDDKKVLFRTFIGVAPARYLEFFTADRPDHPRKDERGRKREFNLRLSAPYLPEYTPPPGVAVSNEIAANQVFAAFLDTNPAGEGATNNE